MADALGGESIVSYVGANARMLHSSRSSPAPESQHHQPTIAHVGEQLSQDTSCDHWQSRARL